MSVTITVLDKTAARIRLELDNPSADTIGSLVRSDHTGTHTVRVESGTFPATTDAVVLDYEYPLLVGAEITYTAYDPDGDALGTLTVDDNTDTGLVYLTSPRRPASSVAVNDGSGGSAGVVVAWDDTRTGQHTVHQVIGRSDPVVVLRPAAARAGTLDISCPDLATAQAVQAALAQPYVFQLRQSDADNLDLYLVATSCAVRPDGDGTDRWTVSVVFAEVAWPSGDIIPITVWTWDDVAAGYGDWQALPAAFDSWADLLERIEA